MILMSLISMLWWRTNVIMMLISLEFFLLSYLTAFIIYSYSSNYYFILIFLTLMVSGSVIGLSFLVALSRFSQTSSSYAVNLITFDDTNYGVSVTSSYQPVA